MHSLSLGTTSGYPLQNLIHVRLYISYGTARCCNKHALSQKDVAIHLNRVDFLLPLPEC